MDISSTERQAKGGIAVHEVKGSSSPKTMFIFCRLAAALLNKKFAMKILKMDSLVSGDPRILGDKIVNFWELTQFEDVLPPDDITLGIIEGPFMLTALKDLKEKCARLSNHEVYSVMFSVATYKGTRSANGKYKIRFNDGEEEWARKNNGDGRELGGHAMTAFFHYDNVYVYDSSGRSNFPQLMDDWLLSVSKCVRYIKQFSVPCVKKPCIWIRSKVSKTWK